VSVRRVCTPRRRGFDLLARPAVGDREAERGWATLVVDPVGQIEELADLLGRRLLSSEEFLRQRAKVLGAPDGSSDLTRSDD
jgi:hypothetical protein